MAATLKVSSFGLVAAQYAILSSAGYPAGTSGSLSNGSSAGMQFITAIKSAGGQANEPDYIFATGNNRRFKHQYILASEQLSKLEMGVAVYDSTFHAVVQGTKVETMGDWAMSGGETDAAVGQTASCLILTQDAQSADTGVTGKRYLNHLFPSVAITPLFASIQEAQVSEYQLRGAPSQVSVTPWGVTLTATTNGFTKAARLMLTSIAYPLTMDTIVCNGSTTSFTLANTPAGTSSSNYIKVWRFSDATLLTSGQFGITTSTKNINISTAGNTAGTVYVAVYEAPELLLS